MLVAALRVAVPGNGTDSEIRVLCCPVTCRFMAPRPEPIVVQPHRKLVQLLQKMVVGVGINLENRDLEISSEDAQAP